MNKFLNVMRAVVLTMALGSLLQAQASVADAKVFQIPGPKAPKDKGIAGATVPYVRYDSQKASLGGGATLKTSAMMDRFNIASQASEHSYVELPGNGASAEWTVHVIEDANVVGRGVTMRFTMPDTGDGMGQKGSLDVYVNGNKVKTVDLNSYWMWQYFASGNPSDAPDGGVGCFAFDEVHFLLDEPLKEGDRIKIQSSGANGLTYGVDFLEIEEVANPIGRPSGAVSVTDFGACPDDGKDDLAAFVAAVKAADAGSKVVYIPKGTWHLSGMWNIYCKDVKITGAGIWYTNIQFTSDKAFGGGISGGNGSNGGADGYCKNLEFCHMYINSNLRSRYNQMAVYKCFMDVFSDGSVIHDVWEEHFETGFWFGDYNGAMDYSDGVKVINCRIRNNLADGVNFCQGTSNAAVYNCSIRNNGDDGLACWNNSYMNAKDEENNVFAYNTIEFIWRAGGIALYGGSGHHVYNNYICDMFMAAGIHLNTTFDGYRFSNNKGITFENNILVRCGTNADSWNEDLAAIDLKQDVKNITFRNTQIYDSPFDAVRTLTGPSNVVFYDTQILGTGLTGEDITYSCVGHTCGAMRIADKNVKFDGLKIANYGSDKKGNNSTYPFWTDNNKDLSQALGAELLGNNVSYVVPEAGKVVGPPVPVVKSTIVNGIKYEIVNDYAQVAGWDELSFPANGIAVIEKNVKIGDNYYDVKRIAGGYDDKLSGSKCDEAGAFYSCSQIKGIVLPDGIEAIGDHAFKNASIEYFNLPGSLSTIGAWAFENTQLTNVTLPWTITNVGEGAFYNIPTLTTVVWTANVWSFPNMVFNSPNVKDVYFTLPYSISEKGDWTWNNNALPRFHTRPAGIESWKSAGYENIDDQVIIKPEENLVPCSFNFDVDFTDVSGISAYKGAYDEGKGAVVLTKVNKIRAQNGFLVRVNDVPVGGYSKEYAARILDNGDDCDSFEGNSIWASTTPTYITDENQYYFANGCFNRLSEPRFVPGMSAWLNLYDKAETAKDVLGFDFLAPPSSTGIHSVQVDNNESAAYYTLSGVKMAKPTTKGVYIYKGKKVVF